jgi:hypothetical protein
VWRGYHGERLPRREDAIGNVVYMGEVTAEAIGAGWPGVILSASL